MMSAPGGRSWKSGHSKGGCVNFIFKFSSKCGRGERGSKNPKILPMHSQYEVFGLNLILRSRIGRATTLGKWCTK